MSVRITTDEMQNENILPILTEDEGIGFRHSLHYCIRVPYPASPLSELYNTVVPLSVQQGSTDDGTLRTSADKNRTVSPCCMLDVSSGG